MSILDNWEQWKDFLGDRLNQAQDQGCTRKSPLVNGLSSW